MKTKLVLIGLLITGNLFSQSYLTKENGKPSLDELDYASFKASDVPFDKQGIVVPLADRPIATVKIPADILLDGNWQLLRVNDFETAVKSDWSKAIPVVVPGSVHTALVNAGTIPDPFFGRNDSIAERHSFMTWFYKKEFSVAEKLNNPILNFDGVAVKCDVWLNGTFLGTHDGMFGGPSFDVSKILKDKNVLFVKIYPAPRVIEGGDGFFNGMNVGWRTTVVFNCVYGWHYSKMPSIGIWRSVQIKNQANVKIVNPFISTKNTDGTMNTQIQLKSVTGKINGVLEVSVVPDNFKGVAQSFDYEIKSAKVIDTLNFTFKIRSPQLWWPNDMGKQNLYKLKVTFVPKDKTAPDHSESTFGIRTIEMAPLPGGPYTDKFNWTFVINGKPHFVKGNGWCTMDPLMNFSRERYDRFLSLAKMQHIQMMRAWGCGMPETDDFYDLCDRYGIMVMQEWQTAWNSHNDQPYEVLEETSRLNTLRIRNHPSLVMYGGGNESDKPFGKAIDMMGRLSIELDGTRPFHRGEPFGGSDHNYTCWWGSAHLDNNLQMTSSFWGEYGIACMPVYESVMRYLPDSEKVQWPPYAHLSLAHHTPIFGNAKDMEKLTQYSGYIMPQDNLQHFITGTQLAQVVAVRHTLERSRTRWPECAGALYYKMNDNYPAASWSCVDWYGAPKPLHYFAQDAFSPVASVILFEHTDMYGRDVNLPVFLLDENLDLKNSDWKVNIRIFNSKLAQTASMEFKGKNNVVPVNKLGVITLSSKQTETSPLLFVSEVYAGGKRLFRTFYYMNFEELKGSLFNLPRTTLRLQVNGNKAVIRNTGLVPAVGVIVECPGKADSFTASDNYIWLDAGEQEEIEVNLPDGLKANAWNLEGNEYVNIPEFKVPIRKFVETLTIELNRIPGYTFRYTTDGSEPDLRSEEYLDPFTVNSTCEIKAKALDSNEQVIGRSSIHVVKIPALESKVKKDNSLKSGLRRTEYKGDFYLLADFAKAEKVDESIQPGLQIDTTPRHDMFGYVYEGYIDIPGTAMYEFYLLSDDGAKLMIDDYPVVVNDGCHAAKFENGMVGLAKGLHSFKLYFFDSQGGQSLNLEWRSDSFLRRKVDNTIFYTK